MLSKKIYSKDFCAACYFRSVAQYPYKKIILQLTEKCNLHCAHCFVSSTNMGNEMSYKQIEEKILPVLMEGNVKKVTLTGGEPFVHKELLKIVSLLVSHDIYVSICTNASLITPEFLEQIKDFELVHFNVSLDGFSPNSHGRFRGNTNIEFFERIISNIRLLGKNKKLNGILVTPNIFANIEEYIDICKFALEVGAKYVLMNPLSQFGRGQGTVDLAFSKTEMLKLRTATEVFSGNDFELIYIRFPNDGKPLSNCIAGNVLYVFTNGSVTICPYMVFAAKDDISKYKPESFILGNIFIPSFNIDEKIKEYILPEDCYENICDNCSFINCGKGCYAAKISRGLHLSDCDSDLCPKINY